jgi:hypothetical protein
MALIGHDRRQAKQARDSRGRPLTETQALVAKIAARRKACG